MRIHLDTYGLAGVLLASTASIARAAVGRRAEHRHDQPRGSNRLIDRAANPAVPVPVPPTGAFVSQADLALRADGELLRGTITLQGEVLRDGPTAVPLLSGGTLIRARVRGTAQPRPPRGQGAARAGPGPGGGRADPAADGVFHAVLPGRRVHRPDRWAGAIVTEPGRASAELPQLGAGTIRATIDAPGEGSDLDDRPRADHAAGAAKGRLIVDVTWRRAARRASAGRRATPGRPRRSARCGCSTT